MKAIIKICAILIPIVTKYATKLLANEKISMGDIIGDTVTVIIEIIISCLLSRKVSKEISKIRKIPGVAGKVQYKKAIKQINIKYQKWGAKISFRLAIPTFFVKALISVIYGKSL